jgi:cytochrome c biogenesis protein ResB
MSRRPEACVHRSSRLTEYEKSPFAHVLSIKYDPYNGAFIAWYIGGFGLMGALIFVFFFSHRRMWALVRRTGHGTAEIIVAGDTNRNHAAFEEKFQKLLAEVQAKTGAQLNVKS